MLIDRIVADERRSDAPPILPWWPVLAIAIYGMGLFWVLDAPLLSAQRRSWISTWATLPVQAVVIACGVILIRSGKLARRRLIGWICVITSLTLNFIGTASWAAAWTPRSDGSLPGADTLYLMAYPPLALIGLLFFLRDLGGTALKPALVLDALALTLATAAAVWGLILMPALESNATSVKMIQIVFASAGLLFPAVLAGVVYTHVSDWRADAGLGALLVAAILNLTGDLLWAGRTLPDVLDEAIRYDLIYVTANAFCVLALFLEGRQYSLQHRQNRSLSYSLLPAIVMLACLISVFINGKPLTSGSTRVSVALLIVGGLVLAARELLSRGEIRRLQEERESARALLDQETRDRGMLFDAVHEGIAQDLAGIRMMLSATRHDEVKSAQAIDAVVTLLDGTISSARRIAEGLAPLKSASGSLPRALELLAEASRTEDFDSSLDASELDPGIAPETAVTVYRLVQNLIDAAKEDESVRELRLKVAPWEGVLCIDASAAATEHEPLRPSNRGPWRMLADRIRVTGGTFALQMEALGWRVTLTLPAARA